MQYITLPVALSGMAAAVNAPSYENVAQGRSVADKAMTSLT